MRTVSGLFVYPVKGMHGSALDIAEIGPRGVRYDREWMMVDPLGNFITQRERPELARVIPAIDAVGLRLSAPGLADVSIPRAAWNTGARLQVRVWNDTCVGVDQGAAVNEWLSQFCGADVRLVRMADDFTRPSRRGDKAVSVGFADGYPLLLISEESLAALNAQLEQPVPMARFRPNIVVRGCEKPYEEDEWNAFSLGVIPMRGVKPCGRCVVTTVDQETGERTGKEPLATLAKVRRVGREALFGMNVNHLGQGSVRVGDEVRNLILGPRPPS